MRRLLRRLEVEQRQQAGFNQPRTIETAKERGSACSRAATNLRGIVPMTLDDDAAAAQLFRERSEARRHRAALETELRTAGKSLHGIGGALRHLSCANIGNRVDHILRELADAPTICDLGRVRALLEELKELETRLDHLNRCASQMGID